MAKRKQASHAWPLNGRIEEIEWGDNASSSGWGAPERYKKDGLTECRSIGYFLHETKEQVTLVQSVDRSTGNINDSISIAKRLIRSRRMLRK